MLDNGCVVLYYVVLCCVVLTWLDRDSHDHQRAIIVIALFEGTGSGVVMTRALRLLNKPNHGRHCG